MDVGEALHQDLVCFPGCVCLEQRRGGVVRHGGGSDKSQRIIDSCRGTWLWRNFCGGTFGNRHQCSEEFCEQERIGEDETLGHSGLVATEGNYRERKVEVHEVLGTENPADLMTKVLTVGEIDGRLRGMSIRMERATGVQQMAKADNGMCELAQVFCA